MARPGTDEIAPAPMWFGLQLHANLETGLYPEIARHAERLGFADVSVHDAPLRRPCWPLLCDIARATSRVLVGPDVTHPWFQHPAVIAVNIAHLDDLSGGRAVLGIGRGSMYDFVNMKNPSNLTGLEEAMRVIGMLLAGDGEEFHGKEFGLGPGPGLMFGSRRRVPVHIGTHGRRGVRLAVRTADGVRVAGQWATGYMEQVRGWVEAAAAEFDRDLSGFELIAENWTYLDPDRERARREARRLVANFLPHLGPMLEFYQISPEEVEAAREASVHGRLESLSAIRDETIDLFMAAGDGDDLRRGLDRWEAAGFHAVSFSGALGPDTLVALDMIGDEITRRRAGAVEPKVGAR